jgi:hypothetical protein
VRHLYIQGRSPRQAAKQAAAAACNARPAADRLKRRRPDDLPFKVVRSNGTDEVLARAVNLLVARGAYRAAVRMYPEDLIELAPSRRVIEKSPVAAV